MKYCESCFAINEDSDLVCISCGASLSTSGNPSSIGGKKKIWIVWAILAVLVVAGLGLLVGKAVFGSKNKLANACLRTVNVAQDDLLPQNWKKTVLGKAASVLQSPMFTFRADYRINTRQLHLDTDYSRKDKVLRGTASYSNYGDNVELGLCYSIASDTLQICAPDLSSSVYGCNLKKLGKVLNNSKLAEILPVTIPEDFPASIFRKTSFTNVLKAYGGEYYDDLVESVESEKLSSRELSLRDRWEKVSVYRVTWSSHAFTKFLSHAWGTKAFSAVGQVLNSIVPEVEPDCLLYVNKDGYMIGFDLVSMGTMYRFLLEGADSLWDYFSLQVTSLYADPIVYTGSAHVNDDTLIIALENEQETFCSLSYDISTGEYSIYTVKSGEVLRGQLTDDNGCYGMSVVFLPQSRNVQELRCQISPIKSTPEPISKEFINLLDMSLTDWQRILLEMNIQINYSHAGFT